MLLLSVSSAAHLHGVQNGEDVLEGEVRFCHTKYSEYPGDAQDRKQDEERLDPRPEAESKTPWKKKNPGLEGLFS